MEFDFTLKFKISTPDGDPDDLIERLGAAGCDDAAVGIGQAGRVALNFTRRARSAREAVMSALLDVKKAIPRASLLEVCPDYVGLTDVAEWVGVSRQNMRKLMLTHEKNFPPPLHEGSAAIWHLAPVLEWLKERGTYEIDQALLDVARLAMQINVAIEAASLNVNAKWDLPGLSALLV